MPGRRRRGLPRVDRPGRRRLNRCGAMHTEVSRVGYFLR